MDTGGHACGDRWLRLLTVRLFVQEALYEQDDALKEDLENAAKR